MADAQIRLRAYNITRKGIAEAKRAMSRLASFTLMIGRRMRGAFRGVFRGLLDIRTLIAGGALTAGLVSSVKQAQRFAEGMAEVATLVPDPKAFEGLADGVRELSTELGIAKDELVKGLYQAISAGVPANDALSFLRDAAKGAVAGVATVAASVDILTTVLNAFQLKASETDRVSDILFTTVKLGKTTLSELAGALANVAPIASASGVSIDEVSAAIATLTKSGTPTAQAVTQVRASIVAMNEVLGDGWADTKTFNEGLLEMSKRAGGSQAKLREMAGRIEAVTGILGLTGKNARMAAEDFRAMAQSSGALGEAFAKMEKVRTWARLFQSIAGFAERLGGAINKGIGNSVKRVTELINWLAKDTAFMNNVGKAFGKMFEYIEDNFGRFVRGLIRRIAVVAAVVKTLMDPQTRIAMMSALNGVIQTSMLNAGLVLAGLIASGIKNGAAFLVNELLRVMPLLGDALLSMIPKMFGGRPSTPETRAAAVAQGRGMVSRHGSKGPESNIQDRIDKERGNMTRHQRAMAEFTDVIRAAAMEIEVSLLKQLPRIPKIIDQRVDTRSRIRQSYIDRKAFIGAGPLGFKKTAETPRNQLEASKGDRLGALGLANKIEMVDPSGRKFTGMRGGRLPSGLSEAGTKSTAGGIGQAVSIAEMFDIMKGTGSRGSTLGTRGNPMITEVQDGMPEVE